MKQYLLLVDDNTKAIFQAACPALQLLEVQGMNFNANDKMQVLVTPIISTSTETVVPGTNEKEKLE